MTVQGIKNRIRRDIAHLRTLKGRRLREFIWDYYKIPIICVASFVLIFALAGVLNVSRGDIAMYAILINANEEVESTLFDDLLADAGMELGEKTVSVTAGYKLGGEFSELYDVQTVQVLAAQFAIGDLDVFAADEPVFSSYAEQDAFVDMSLFMEPELLEKMEADLYWYENTDGVQIAGGVWLRQGSALHKAGYYSGDVLIGVVANAQNLDEAVAAVLQIMREK